MKTLGTLIVLLCLAVFGITGAIMAAPAIQPVGLNQLMEARLEPASTEDLERYGLDVNQQIAVCSFPVAPGEHYTLEIQYPADEHGFRYTVFQTDPLSSSPKWAIATSGQGQTDPTKPGLITKLRLAIDLESPGDMLYVLLVRPAGDYRLVLKSPADPGVEEAAVMPGWEELGNLYYYHDHKEPIYLETSSLSEEEPAVLPTLPTLDAPVPPPLDQVSPAVTYQHQPGDFAVVLDWEGDFDLELEIWTSDFVHINTAYGLGDSIDITHGDQGVEWVVFKDYPEIVDLSQGRYVISPYFSSPETDQPALASLTVYFPDGESMVLERELFYLPPHDQWFAVLVDVDQGTVETLDFFEEPVHYGDSPDYQHQPGDFAVVLDWEGDFDLDLEIWSDDFNYLGKHFSLGESMDITHGDQGVEWLVFKDYSEMVDLSTGRYVISPYLLGGYDELLESVIASLTVYFPDGESMVLERELFFDHPYNQWFAVLVDVDQGTVETLDFFEEPVTTRTSSYEYQPGELAVALDWQGDFDLDLEIWSETLHYLGTAYGLGDAADNTHGDQGPEWFVFREGQETSQLDPGRYVITPFFKGPLTDQGVLATLTVFLPDGERVVLERELFYTPPYDQWFAVQVDTEKNLVKTLDYFKE